MSLIKEINTDFYLRIIGLVLCTTLFTECGEYQGKYQKEKLATEEYQNDQEKRKRFIQHRDSFEVLYASIKKSIERYSVDLNWQSIIKKYGKWIPLNNNPRNLWIDVSTAHLVSILINDTTSTNAYNIENFEDKNDTIVFNTTTINNRQITFFLIPVDSIHKIVKWEMLENNTHQSLGIFMDKPRNQN